MNVFVKLMSSGVVIQLLMIITTLIFTRLYSVQDFGELAFYSSYGSIIAVTSNLRFDYLNLKEHFTEKYIGYLVSNILTVIINIVIISLLLIIDYKFNVLQKYNLTYLFIFGLSFGLFQNATQYLISVKKYKNFISSRLIQVLLIFVIGTTLFLINFKFNALIFAYSISQLSLAIVLFIYISYLSQSKGKLYKSKKLFITNVGEGLKNTAITFVQYGAPLTPVFIGGVLFNEKYIGAYFVFAQMLSAPLSVIRRNLLIFLNGEFNTPAHLSRLSFKVNKHILLLIAVGILSIILILYFFNSQITRLILGQQWLSFSYLLLPLAIYFIIDTFLQPLTTLLPLWGNVNYLLSFETLKLLSLTVFLPLVTIIFNLSFLEFIQIYIIIMVSVYLIIVNKTIKTLINYKRVNS